MNSSHYIIVAGANLVDTRSSKPAAVRLAEATALEFPGHAVLVATAATGTVVHEIAPTVSATGRAKPYTRVEQPTFDAPAIEGFTPAYTRRRVQAVVYRADERVDGGFRYIVLHAPTGERFEASDTNEARTITNALAQHRKEQREQQAAKAKAEKEAVRAAKAAAEQEKELATA